MSLSHQLKQEITFSNFELSDVYVTTHAGNEYIYSVFSEIDMMQKFMKSTHKCLIDDVRTINEQADVDKCDEVNNSTEVMKS